MDLILFNKILFSLFLKTDLTFLTNQVLFIYLFYPHNIFEFSLKRGHIHKADLFKLIFVKCLSCVFNISFNIMQKRVYWSLESKRPDFV